MARPIYVPQAGRFVNFSDTASDEDIKSYIRTNYPKPEAVAPPAPEAAPVPSSDESGLLQRGAYGFLTGFTDIPGGIASLMYPAEEAAKTSAGQWSAGNRAYLQKQLGIDPTKEATTGQMLAQGLGSALGFVVPGGAVAKGAGLLGAGARAASLAGSATVAAQGAALNAGSRSQRIQEQLAAGMEISPETQLAAQRLDGLIGLSEALPMHKFFGPIGTLLSKVPASKAPLVEKIISSRLASITKAGAEEAAQEAASNIASDLMEYGVYNPDVQIGQDIVSNAAGGAFAGSVLEGVIQLAAGRKLRGFRQLQSDLEAEKQKNNADARRLNIASAADELAKSNAEGILSVEQNEDPEGNVRHTIFNAEKKPLADTYSPEDAVSAINLYKQKTGANVEVDIKEPPALRPVKIAGASFPSIENAVAEHEKVKTKVADLEKYSARQDLIEAQAKKLKVPVEGFKKQVSDTLKKERKKLAMFDAYFSAEPVVSKAETPTEPGPAIQPTAPVEAAPVAAAPVTPEAAPAVQEAPVVGQPTADITEAFAAPEVAPEPITSEEQVPEMPIGAVELPIEESRILPDTIVDNEFVPETGIEPAPVRVEKRPSANPEQLMALRTELFGKPLGWHDMTPEQRAVYEAERDKRFPPQDVEIYYAAGQINEPLPKTYRDATVSGPVVRDYSPEEQQRIKDIYTKLMARLGPIAPSGTMLRLKTLVDSRPGYLIRGQADVIETPDGLKTVIDLSTGILEPGMPVEKAVQVLADTMNHEIIHALRDAGLIRPAEWRILSRSVANTNVPGKKYTYLDKAEAVYAPIGPDGVRKPISKIYEDPKAVAEEAVAEMYREWVINRNKPKDNNSVGILNRITEFFRRIFQTLRSSGHDSVFEKISSGEIGKREPVIQARETRFSATETSGEEGGMEVPQAEEQPQEAVRFSAAPLPPYVEEQNKTLFNPAPKIRFRDMLSNYVFGHSLPTKIVRVNGRDVEISSRTMKAVAAKTAAVDNAAYLAELEKIKNQQETGNYQRQVADYSATAAIAWLRRASHVMASMMLRGNLSLDYATPGDILSATMKVTDDPDSLKEVFKIMTQPAAPKANGEAQTKADIFKTYAVARRGEWLRSTGQTVPRELTPQYIREAIEFTQREYPEVVEAYNMYQRFNKKLMTTVRDAGLISTAELGRLTNEMNYYGFIYEAYGEPLGPTTGQKAASQFKLRPYTGTQHGGLVNDPMFVMIQNAQFMVTSVAKNIAAVKSFELAKDMGEARLLQTGESPNEMAGEQKDVMFFSRNGVVHRFAVKDPLMVTALGSDDRINVGKFWEVMGLPAHILRESVTRDPGFMARNLLRDTLSSWITSGVDFTPVIGTLRNFGRALKDSSSFRALGARGVVGSYDLAMQTPEQLAATFRRNLPKNVHMFSSVEAASNAARSLWNRLGHVSEASDAATRMAVYDACIAQGMSEAEASMQAIELLDFTRRGGSQTLGILTKLIPFLNARIQGMDVLYQAGRSGIRYVAGRSLGERDANIGKKFMIRGGMLAALSMMLELMNQDDEDYQQIDDYIKDGNLLIPLKEFGLKGQFAAIPKPFEAGLLFSTFPQQIVKALNGDASTRQTAGLFFNQMGATFGVNPIPQVLLPGLEIITNHSFYTGLPLISEGKARLSPELQYNTSTSQLAMMIGNLPIFYDFTSGKFEGASPIVIDKIISGYGGPIGSYMAMAVSLGMQGFEVGPERMPVELANAPVVRSFFIDAKSKNPKVVTQAYELFQIADEANRTVSRLKQMGDAEALADYIDKNRDILTYKKYIFKLADSLNKISAQERYIERNTTMTPDEKIAAQQELRDIRIRLASNVDEINKKLGR